ncbi:cytochrome c oxidase assembly protein [Citricoccus nitrophenolicus]|uniref:Cytochrome c oxidase assembly protein n=1 Tax=Citricoccus nitrophenolicus TaxID=863575 RepID=A0ABV0IM08_9MICC
MDEAGMDGPVWIPTEPPSLENFLAPTLQPIPLIPAIAVVLGLLYLAGALRLWSARRRWPVWRALCFLLGCAAIAVTMGAGVEGYGLKMFSVFIFQQLTLMIAIPPLLVLGSPGTLLLRATPHRGPGRVVLRLAQAGLRSWLGRIALHPGFTIPLFLITYYGIYLSGLDDRLLPTWYGHTGLELLFLASGILFTVPLLSSDPLPARQGFGGRMFDVAIEMPLHAFFGVVLMMATTPIVEFFATPPASWGLDPMEDQQIAGGLAWAYGELPTVLILVFIAHQWFRADTRQARRADAEADLNGTPELDAYNAYLEQLAAGTPPGPSR